LRAGKSLSAIIAEKGAEPTPASPVLAEKPAAPSGSADATIIFTQGMHAMACPTLSPSRLFCPARSPQRRGPRTCGATPCGLRGLARHAWPWTAALALAGCGPAGPAGPAAEDGASPASAAAADVDSQPADPQAAELAEKLLAAYRQARSYADNAVYVQYFILRGEGVERETPFFQMSLAFERPNKLRLRFEEAVAGSQGRLAYDVACDGKVMRSAAASLPDQVQCSEAPTQLTADNLIPDALIRDSVLQSSLENVFPQLAMLLSESDETPVFPQDEEPRLLEDVTLDGRPCRRVATQSAAGRRVLWIDAETLLVRRMELPIEGQRAALDPDNQYRDLSVRIDFLDASLDVDVAEASFDLDIPASARLVAQLVKPPCPDLSPDRAQDEENLRLLQAARAEASPPPDAAALRAELDAFYAEVDSAAAQVSESLRNAVAGKP
jgi:outer membrane lipoprotein-sorting protein